MPPQLFLIQLADGSQKFDQIMIHHAMSRDSKKQIHVYDVFSYPVLLHSSKSLLSYPSHLLWFERHKCKSDLLLKL